MTARHLVHQLRYEQLSYWRNPAGVFFTVALPVVMLAIFTTLNEGDTDGAGRSFASYFVPGMVTFGLISSAYGNLAARIVLRRETGLFKRAKAAPIAPVAVVGGLVAHAMVIAMLVSTIVTLVGAVVFDVAVPERLGLFVTVIVVGSASFAALGAAVSTAIPNIEAADPIVFATILPVLFISGVFDQVPADSVLDRVADVFPVRHLFDVALASAGRPLDAPHLHLLYVAAWGAVGAGVASRRFRWQPST
jgi:ABC-2 type transport system permease protein